jgi:hypothetical protein
MAETAPLRLLDAKGCGARRFQNQNWRALVKQILAHAPKLDLSFRTISPTRSVTQILAHAPKLDLSFHAISPTRSVTQILAHAPNLDLSFQATASTAAEHTFFAVPSMSGRGGGCARGPNGGRRGGDVFPNVTLF